jgi:hypothetical protein
MSSRLTSAVKFERDVPAVEWEPVERGLREWFICCAYRRRRPLGTPSRSVDYAWHAFILDTASYRTFCNGGGCGGGG